MLHFLVAPAHAEFRRALRIAGMSSVHRSVDAGLGEVEVPFHLRQSNQCRERQAKMVRTSRLLGAFDTLRTE